MCLYGVWESVCRAASRSRGGRYSGRTPVFGCALAEPRSVAQNFWRLQNETVHSLRYRLLISTPLNNCIGESTFLDACSQTGLLYESTGAFRAPGRRWMVVVAQSRAEPNIQDIQGDEKDWLFFGEGEAIRAVCDFTNLGDCIAWRGGRK